MIDLNDLLEKVSRKFKVKLEGIASDQNSTSINLSYNYMGDDEAILLAKVLNVHTSIKEVGLGGNKIGQKGGIALAETLLENTILERLLIGMNQLDSKAGQAFAKVLQINTTLKELDFGEDNNFDIDTALAFVDMLNKNTSLTSFGMMALDLGPDVGRDFAIMLERNATLTTLNLGRNNFGPQTGNVFARALSKNKTLRDLHLFGNGLGTITGLSLAKVLEQNTTLQELSLDQNNFESEVAVAFVKVIQINTTLQRLTLIENQFSTEACFRLVDALENNITLIDFELRSYTDPDRPFQPMIDKYIQRNKKIQEIRKQIATLSSDAAYTDLEKALRLDLGTFNVKRYHNILSQIETLPESEFSDSIKQNLTDEAMIARCSWDNGDDIDARIKQLKDIIIRVVSQDPKSLRFKALTCLAPIIFTKAVQCSQTEGTKATATRYLVEACVAAMHGQHNEITKGILCDALSFWLGKKDVDATPEQLLQDLQKHDIQSFKELCFRVCLDLVLPPFILQVEIKPIPLLLFTKDPASRGDSKEFVESKSLSHKSETMPRRKTDSEARFTSALSLDADAGLDHESSDPESLEQESHAQAHFNAYESGGEGYSEAEAKSEAEEQMVQQGIMNSLQAEPPGSRPN